MQMALLLNFSLSLGIAWSFETVISQKPVKGSLAGQVDWSIKIGSRNLKLFPLKSKQAAEAVEAFLIRASLIPSLAG